MSRSYVKILLTVFLTQSIVAQFSPVTWNGCHSCQNINSQPSGSNSNNPVASNNGFINGQENGFGQLSGHGQQTGYRQQSGYVQQNGNLLNELQSIPQLSFVNGQITDLINFASKINKRQLTENNYSKPVYNLPSNNNNEPVYNLPSNNNNQPVYNLPFNNPCSQVNGLGQVNNNNNQLNNVPVTFFPNTIVQNNVDNLQSSNTCSQVNCLDQGNNNNPLNNVPITFFPNTVVQNNVDNVMSSNPCSQVNCLDQGNNKHLNNVPISFYPNLNPGIQNNLVPNNVGPMNCGENNPVLNNFDPNTALPISFYPNNAPNNVFPTNVLNNIPNNLIENNDVPFVSNVSPCNNGINTNNYQQNLLAPCSSSLVDLPKINSLILTGEACNNGQPFSVLPANSFNAQDVSIYNDIIDNGYKITRSLLTETSYPANNVENNIIPVQNFNAYNVSANPLQNKVIGKLIPGNNNLANNVHDASLNNGQPAVIGNNIYYNKQLISNQQPSVNQWQPPANQNNRNILTATNWPAINIGSQLTGNVIPEITDKFNLPQIVNMPDANYNLPDLANINMLNLGELGTLPIFSGLPVISITETVSVFDPEQFNYNHI